MEPADNSKLRYLKSQIFTIYFFWLPLRCPNIKNLRIFSIRLRTFLYYLSLIYLYFSLRTEDPRSNFDITYLLERRRITEAIRRAEGKDENELNKKKIDVGKLYFMQIIININQRWDFAFAKSKKMTTVTIRSSSCCWTNVVGK
jgi:hypothetical protein